MRCAAVFVALLLRLHWTWAQSESGGVTGNNVTRADREIKNEEVQSEIHITPPDIWAELKELRDMVIDQRGELRNSKSKIEKLEQENTGDARVVNHTDQCQCCTDPCSIFIFGKKPHLFGIFHCLKRVLKSAAQAKPVSECRGSFVT